MFWCILWVLWYLKTARGDMNLTAQCILTRDEMESRRLEAARDLLAGISQSAVARKFGVSRTTVSRWNKALAGRGVESLRKRRAPGRPCRLSAAQLEQVRELFAAGPRRLGLGADRWTTLRLATAIEMQLGVRYDPDHVGRIMHRLGLSSKTEPEAAFTVAAGGNLAYPASLYSPNTDLSVSEISPTVA
ncbi:MAG TPA: helix-turn-helix domain-containing protein [Bryobacteraceae bacterium]|nr:helix-turn-helix domain-containing protein [Bryobacteraceae bacterium]